ncbi:cysteine desulfurase [Telmatocola sphagniphila]|uniref:Cysteine desulfurase n=1 Tax=Telmatocola sphagniphila TaxID=1123043 RepID=A0A8E6B3F9_9BACT|nr:cysteine desulfurase family protein [Telmatocola sphagniphila]QVL29838.1 cysteine desulfurase [Telmatocola sphagniphila]
MLYLDANSTTPVNPAVREAMLPWLGSCFGNPSSAHRFGRKARQALEDARDQIAGLLHADSDEVVFTSGATESNNLALFGLVPESPCRFAVSPIEHLCVTEPAKRLQARGYIVDPIEVDSQGIVNDLNLDSSTRLICIMRVNHETGAIQPISDLVNASRIQAPQTLFHCDAAQAVGKLPVNFRELGVDSLSVSGHKFHAPQGVGLLLVRKGLKLRPALFGGHQQQGRRPGTESVILAIGLAKALELAEAEREQAWVRLSRLQSRFWELLRDQAVPAIRNSPPQSSPYVLNVSFPGCRAELLLMKLDMLGVACSTGSACSSGSLLPSPVLKAMHAPEEILRSAMRFSWTRDISEIELEQAAAIIARAVAEVRGQ